MTYYDDVRQDMREMYGPAYGHLSDDDIDVVDALREKIQAELPAALARKFDLDLLRVGQ